MSHRSPFVILVLAVGLCACSGSSQTAGQSGPSPEPSPEPEAPSVAQYETFDPSAYEARPPDRAVEVVHQVPKRLMRGHAARGVRRTVEGFRVQVFSARDKQAAQAFRERVRRWWERNKDAAPTSVLGQKPPIVVTYTQPYYRVRIGAFAEREAAEEALEFVAQRYENAFIARGTVTVTK
ncbi:MAG: SPOR domain-containing protein [Salinibacter sp.]